MKSLMQEIATEAGVDGPSLRPPGEEDGGEPLTEEEREQQRRFKAAWEAMLVEGMGGEMDPESIAKGKASSSSGASAGTGVGADAGAGVDDFQASIRKAMEKLKESDAHAQVSLGDMSCDDACCSLCCTYARIFITIISTGCSYEHNRFVRDAAISAEPRNLRRRWCNG